MATRLFLAMTASEIAACPHLPENIGYMACHFSPYGAGLSGLPGVLPERSLLILNDSHPIHGHDPEQIAAQLSGCMTQLGCSALLLDFQRPGCEEAADLARFLNHTLPCPVVVSDFYANGLDCPVFLPPVPLTQSLAAYLAPWRGREIWLDIGADAERLTLTEQGCTAASLPRFSPSGKGHFDKGLHCHYEIETGNDVRFTLWRTTDDLAALIAEAEEYGITAVGLWQELRLIGICKNRSAFLQSGFEQTQEGLN